MNSTARTVLITGSSSGIGAATQRYFLDQGWNVVATSRLLTDAAPEPRCLRVQLDVTNATSVDRAFTTAIECFGQLHAVINNAGYGLSGSFESISDEAIRRQFETNVFGLMRVSRSALGHFRQQGGGVLVNISSMGGKLSFPFYSPYHASKWAVEGFSESLAFEAAEIGVRVKLIEPGAVRTDFYGRSAEFVHDPNLMPYQGAIERSRHRMQTMGSKGCSPEQVAATIWQAVTDDSEQLRYPVGSDARMLLGLRRFMSDRRYLATLRKRLMA